MVDTFEESERGQEKRARKGEKRQWFAWWTLESKWKNFQWFDWQENGKEYRISKIKVKTCEYDRRSVVPGMK